MGGADGDARLGRRDAKKSEDLLYVTSARLALGEGGTRRTRGRAAAWGVRLSTEGVRHGSQHDGTRFEARGEYRTVLVVLAQTSTIEYFEADFGLRVPHVLVGTRPRASTAEYLF